MPSHLIIISAATTTIAMVGPAGLPPPPAPAHQPPDVTASSGCRMPRHTDTVGADLAHWCDTCPQQRRAGTDGLCDHQSCGAARRCATYCQTPTLFGPRTSVDGSNNGLPNFPRRYTRTKKNYYAGIYAYTLNKNLMLCEMESVSSMCADRVVTKEPGGDQRTGW